MSHRNLKPVVLVAAGLAALIVVPLVLVWFAGGPASDPGTGVAGARAETADFDLRRLSERSNELFAGPVAKAVREGEISLDLAAELERLRTRAEDALARGKVKRAKKAYTELIARTEAALEAVALADEARSLQASVFEDLRRLERYRAVFEQTYSEAVGRYDKATSVLAERDFPRAIEGFKGTATVLGELETRAVSQIEDLMEAADAALERYELEAARSAYEEVLRIDSRHAGASKGLERVGALAEIGDEVRQLEALEAEGRFEAALGALAELERRYPGNPYISGKRASLKERIVERDYRDLLAAAGRAEGAGDFDAAIEALEQALELRPDAGLEGRIREIAAKRDAARLETLLASGYEDLSAGRYEQARERYREAIALAPENAEARTGFEKASSLYFTSIRYRENLANAAKFSAEGRYPLAAKFFNDAMASRPVKLPESVEEREIRRELERQSKEVPVTVRSDKRTYVSLIGVFPPERFREKDLRLFPDVYTFKGTRPGYREVEVTLKVNARKSSQEVEVVCEEKL